MNDMMYFEMSAKANIGVEEAINAAIQDVIDSQHTSSDDDIKFDRKPEPRTSIKISSKISAIPSTNSSMSIQDDNCKVCKCWLDDYG